VNQKEYWEEGTPWQIQTGKEVSVLTKQGYKSAIDKFKLEDENGNDLTEQILHLPKVYLFFLINRKIFTKNIHQKKLEENFKKAKYLKFQQKNVFKTIPNLTMDGTAIKTIARSNPFVLVLENGKIVEKKSLEDFLKH
jgi:hypothetical protein